MTVTIDGQEYNVILEPVDKTDTLPDDFPKTPYYMCEEKPKLSVTHPDHEKMYQHSWKMFNELSDLWICYPDPTMRFARFMACYDVLKKDTWIIPPWKISQYPNVLTNEYGQKRI